MKARIRLIVKKSNRTPLKHDINLTTWVVILTKKAGKNLKKLPKEIIEIMDQFRRYLEAEGPTPSGWIVKQCKVHRDASAHD